MKVSSLSCIFHGKKQPEKISRRRGKRRGRSNIIFAFIPVIIFIVFFTCFQGQVLGIAVNCTNWHFPSAFATRTMHFNPVNCALTCNACRNDCKSSAISGSDLFLRDEFETLFNFSVYYFYNPTCSICQEKLVVINEFLTQNGDIVNNSVHFVSVYSGNQANDDFAREYLSRDIVPYPVVIFEVKTIKIDDAQNKSTVVSTCKFFIGEEYIKASNLGNIYNSLKKDMASGAFSCGKDSIIIYGQMDLFFVFVTGLISSLSPCVILITAAFGGTFLAQLDGKKRIRKRKFLIYNCNSLHVRNLAGLFLYIFPIYRIYPGYSSRVE
ncbi:MAG: hypothetical protein ACTSVI_08035 [Promethearchaeota archaeon]